ncbi:unnamed protein product, partial [Closterium sp. NIES-53]
RSWRSRHVPHLTSASLPPTIAPPPLLPPLAPRPPPRAPRIGAPSPVRLLTFRPPRSACGALPAGIHGDCVCLVSPILGRPQMEVDALAIVATALAHSSPGGDPGRQFPALLRAASALAGHGSSRPFRERRAQGRRSGNPVFRSPPGRARACLRLRQQQMFRCSQRPPIPPPRPGRRPGSLPRSQQSPLQPTPPPLPAPVTQTTPPPQSVPNPLSGPAPASAVVPPGGWQRVKLSRHQKRRQFRQPAPMPSQPPLAPPRQQPRPLQPPSTHSPLRRFPLPPQPPPPHPPASPAPQPSSSAAPSPAPLECPQLFLGGRRIPIPWEVMGYLRAEEAPDVQSPPPSTQPSSPPPPVSPDPSPPPSPEGISLPGSPPRSRAYRITQRVGHVGTCLTLLAMVLNQLHLFQLWQMRPGEVPPVLSALEQEEGVAAAMQMLEMLPLIGLVPDSPGAALGPGPAALRRLVLPALKAPRDVVPPATSMLRWMDGWLSWILAE